MRSLLPSSTRSTRIAALLLLLPAAAARAEDLESDAVYLPAETTSAMAVRNPLGTVKLQGWDRPQIRIIAHKRAGSRALLERLKVRVDLDGGDVRLAENDRCCGDPHTHLRKKLFLQPAVDSAPAPARCVRSLSCRREGGPKRL